MTKDIELLFVPSKKKRDLNHIAQQGRRVGQKAAAYAGVLFSSAMADNAVYCIIGYLSVQYL